MRSDVNRTIHQQRPFGRKLSGVNLLSICLVVLAALTTGTSQAFAQHMGGAIQRSPMQRPTEATGQIKRNPAAATQQPNAAVTGQAKLNRTLNRKVLRKPSDPEAAALLLNLIARYAANVPDKSDLDRRIEASLGKSSRGRQIAQTIINRFQEIPLQMRQEAYGQYANVTTQLFERSRYDAAFRRVTLPAAKGNTTPTNPRSYSRPRSLGVETTYQFRYKGMACFAETSNEQISGSDEIYIVTSLVALENGQPVTRTFMKGVFEPVDEGGTFPDPGTILYEGPAQSLAMVSVMMEQDYGNANEQREIINTVVKTAIEAAYSSLTGTPPAGLVKYLIGAISQAIADLVVNVLDLKDDVIEEERLTLTSDQLIAFGVSPPPLNYQGISYHFDLLHEGDGAFYRTYYDVKRIDPDVPCLICDDPPPPRGFVPAAQASANHIEGLWGDASLKENSKIVARITGTPSRSGTFRVNTSEQIIGGSKVTASAEGLQLTTDGTWSYVKPFYDLPTPLKDAPGGAVRVGDALGGRGASGGGRGGVGSGASVGAGAGRIPGGRAYTLVLPDNIQLQVFIEDRPPEEVRNYRIRYVRLSGNGRILTDVMLRPTQPKP